MDSILKPINGHSCHDSGASLDRPQAAPIKGLNIVAIEAYMATGPYLKVGVCMSLGFWGFVLWAIVETVVKADNYWIRFKVAMGCVGLDVLGFLWLFGLLFVKYIAGNDELRSNTPRQSAVDAVTRHVKGTPLVPPFIMVEVQVDGSVHESDASECRCDGMLQQA